MEYPFLMEAYTPTNSGDAVYEKRRVNNAAEVENFKNEFSNRFYIRMLEIPSNYLDDANRLIVVQRIKDRVPIEHAVSVMNSLVRLREEISSKDENLFFRIDAPLMESISVQVINDERFDRTKSEKDYFIIFRKKETNTPNISVGGDFHGNLNTGSIQGDQTNIQDSDIERLTFNPVTNPPIYPTMQAANEGIITSIGKFIVKNVIVVIITALIIAYIVYRLGWN